MILFLGGAATGLVVGVIFEAAGAGAAVSQFVGAAIALAGALAAWRFSK